MESMAYVGNPLFRQIADCLDSMQGQVRKGDFVAATAAGNQLQTPIAAVKEQIVLGPKLSDGASSSVFAGTYRGHAVAVKRAHIRVSADLTRFRKEVTLLGSLQHPCIVRLVAARALPPDYMILMPLMTTSLQARLHEDGWRPSWPALLSLARDVASALACVHGAGVVHRDVKPGNLLFDGEGRVALADFGIAELESELVGTKVRAAPSGGFHKDRIVGTLQYLAPEVLSNNHHTKAADVYAFAVTVNEMATGTFPFADCTKDNPAAHTVLEMGYGQMELAAAVARDQLRPTLPASSPQGWPELMAACWHADAAARPSFASVVASLSDLLSALAAADALNALEPSAQASPADAAEGAAQPAAAAAREHLHASVARAGAEGAGGAPARRGDDLKDGTPLPEMPWESGCDVGCTPPLLCAAYETAGLRGADKMEDRHVIVRNLGNRPHVNLLAVFDGHRGAEAAAFAAEHAASQVVREWPEHDCAERVIQATFLALDARFVADQDARWADRLERLGADAAGARTFPGCTAIILLQVHGKLFVGNVGDCRAVICHGGQAVALTRDHTADDEDERDRIAHFGGLLAKVKGHWRIGTAGLQVSRSLGDADLREAGVLPAPEITTQELTEHDEFVIIASDGLWDKLSNEDAVAIVHNTVKDPGMAAKRLATEALTRGSNDNITVVVAFLRDVASVERVYKDGEKKYAHARSAHGTLAAYHEPIAQDEMVDGY